ncbi:hypothetical protein JCM10207_005295 [Rhodosporidiobolus poonsookiae]
MATADHTDSPAQSTPRPMPFPLRPRPTHPDSDSLSLSITTTCGQQRTSRTATVLHACAATLTADSLAGRTWRRPFLDFLIPLERASGQPHLLHYDIGTQEEQLSVANAHLRQLLEAFFEKEPFKFLDPGDFDSRTGGSRPPRSYSYTPDDDDTFVDHPRIYWVAELDDEFSRVLEAMLSAETAAVFSSFEDELDVLDAHVVFSLVHELGRALPLYVPEDGGEQLSIEVFGGAVLRARYKENDRQLVTRLACPSSTDPSTTTPRWYRLPASSLRALIRSIALSEPFATRVSPARSVKLDELDSPLATEAFERDVLRLETKCRSYVDGEPAPPDCAEVVLRRAILAPDHAEALRRFPPPFATPDAVEHEVDPDEWSQLPRRRVLKLDGSDHASLDVRRDEAR